MQSCQGNTGHQRISEEEARPLEENRGSSQSPTQRCGNRQCHILLARFERLKETGLPVECGSGGLTKYNRSIRNLPKTHWLDAACVGRSTPETLHVKGIVPLLIKSCGHGCRQMCLMNKFGFVRTGPKEAKFVKAFQTGDVGKAIVTKGSKVGTYVGRIAVRTSGSFNITTAKETIQGISFKYCQAIQRMDGYSYRVG